MKNKFINIHFHANTGDCGIQNIFIEDFDAEKLCGSLLSVGIHPYHCACADTDAKIQKLQQIATLPQVAAIGEIGLDKSIAVDYNLQKKVFEQQLLIANHINKPVIIHCVRAFADIVEIYKRNKISVAMIFHGFIGKPETVEQIAKIGCYTSFDSRIIDNRSWDAAIKKAYDLNIILFETDDKNIAIENVYASAANVIGIEIYSLQSQVQQSEICKLIFGNF